MNDIIEKVAHAIATEELGGDIGEWEDFADIAKERYCAIARAAIKAIPKPMVDDQAKPIDGTLSEPPLPPFMAQKPPRRPPSARHTSRDVTPPTLAHHHLRGE